MNTCHVKRGMIAASEEADWERVFVANLLTLTVSPEM